MGQGDGEGILSTFCIHVLLYMHHYMLHSCWRHFVDNRNKQLRQEEEKPGVMPPGFFTALIAAWSQT